MKQRTNWALRVVKAIGAMLQEIFDESGYARFLVRRSMANSRQAYAEFLQENERVKARRPKCC